MKDSVRDDPAGLPATSAARRALISRDAAVGLPPRIGMVSSGRFVYDFDKVSGPGVPCNYGTEKKRKITTVPFPYR
ncbi:MAG: hypothetical protein PHQ27_04860 [Victivallales bacterium]|nr:hypothetical protein [Victivallales bacterium]